MEVLTGYGNLWFNFCPAADKKAFLSVLPKKMTSPIDAVVPLGPNDEDLIQTCIDSIYNHVAGIRYVFVIAHRPIDLSNCIVLQESDFPFSKKDIADLISEKRAGWYLQQLIKLHAPLLISNILENVLVVDADTIFYKRTRFMENGKYLFDRVMEFPHRPYFEHMRRLHPSFLPWKPNVSGITNCMILNKQCLQDMMAQVEAYHKTDFWRAYLLCVEPTQNSGAADYEVYFHWMMRNKADQVRVRPLQWTNGGQRSKLGVKSGDWHYVTYHWHSQMKPLRF